MVLVVYLSLEANAQSFVIFQFEYDISWESSIDLYVLQPFIFKIYRESD